MENKYQAFIKGEGFSLMRSFSVDEDIETIIWALDNEADCEDAKLIWLKENGKRINLKKYAKMGEKK